MTLLFQRFNMEVEKNFSSQGTSLVIEIYRVKLLSWRFPFAKVTSMPPLQEKKNMLCYFNSKLT